MSFFDDVKTNAGICAGKVSRKADAAVEISRLKLNEKALQREIGDSLKLLGAKVYKAYNTESDTPDLSSDILGIRDMYDRLKLTRAQIAELKEAEFTIKKTEKDEKSEEKSSDTVDFSCENM